jgi:Ca-activated chloride channel family protein
MLEQFHFSQPFWLWFILIIPLVWLFMPRSRKTPDARFAQYADSHLLPHVLIRQTPDLRGRRTYLKRWSLLWLIGCLAMAGPRWDFTDIKVFQPGSDLVVLMDLSRSMESTDVKPSRLARARQELDDLFNLNTSVRVGLVAFATVAHVVAPVTEDMQTLRHLLPSLSPNLIQLQGSRLSGALERARVLLAGQPAGNHQGILLVSDGDFIEPGLEQTVRELHEDGIYLYVLGIGTPQGGSIPGSNGGWLQDARGRRVVSRLEEGQLQLLAQAGGGMYQQADYRDSDSKALLAHIQNNAPPRLKENPIRVWHERYYILMSVMLALLLSLFRQSRQFVWHT